MSPRPTPDETDDLAIARQILTAEADALRQTADRLDDAFRRAADRLADCAGRVALTGVGKSADVAAKVAGTFNSTGTRAYTLDATRAVHGDLGMVHPDDVALVFSHSGDGDELGRLLGPLCELASGVVALTGNRSGRLARVADVAIVYGPVAEACPLALAPSSSTTVMLALGDALAFALSRRRHFTPEQFARYHPAGSLGRQLARVESMMRVGDELRIAGAGATVREVFAACQQAGRRTGAVILIDDDGRLCGLFTDSDLARLFERRRDDALDRPIREVMTANPLTVTMGCRVGEALELMRRRKISELPVVDPAGRPVGLLDVTDLLGLPVKSAVVPARAAS